jgi:hypothetical protein
MADFASNQRPIHSPIFAFAPTKTSARRLTLNRDLVLMGLFLHDLGKTAELEWEKGFTYTADGNLIGHVVRGAVWRACFAGH